ncbi:MAG TPA: transcriptional repressor LexA [Opitutaceae bacterium]|nr:transcriptional repressor LexA [Opitutaceae bacterium]
MLTERQQEILDHVRAHRRAHGLMPSLREIQQHFRLKSVATVAQHLDALQAKGALQREPGKARSLALPQARSTIELPLFGTIPAGLPSANEALAEDQVPVDPALFKLRAREEAFALRVRGDSMEGAGIVDGDLVILACREPKARDIVGALVDGESTLKRLAFNRGKPVLLAENPRYRPITATEELLIQGVYVGHIHVPR